MKSKYRITLLESDEQPIKMVDTKRLVAFFRYILRDYAVDGDIMDFLMKGKVMSAAQTFGIRYTFESDDVCQYMAQFYRLNERLIDEKGYDESSFEIPVKKKFEVYGSEETKSYVLDTYKYSITGYNAEDIRYAFEFGDLEIYDGDHIDSRTLDGETLSTAIDSVKPIEENIQRIKGLLIS